MDSIARRTKAPEMNRCFLVLIFVVEMVWGASTPPLSTAAQVKNHWAFQAVKPPVLPNVSGAKWPRTPVDRFVLAGLEAWGRVPSPRADRRTLIRRASFDLTGLAPTFAEVQTFVADDSPNAWPKLIDRLLASPHYGERWARHWLDVARYADNKGYVGVGVDRLYPYSYTYRDYVVRAFNEDLPYNRFVLEQIAADQLELGDDKRPLAAMGYLTLGRRFLNREDDIIDDRIDVVTRGFMALTVTCARCHDHKYDPIPTADYYSLHGVFASSHEPKELPLLGKGSLPPQHAGYLKEKQRQQAAIDALVRDTYAKGRAELRRRAGEYLGAVYDVEFEKLKKKAAVQLLIQRKLNIVSALNWQRALAKWKVEKHPVFLAWHRLEGEGNPLVKRAPDSKAQVKIYSDLFVEVERQWNALRKKDRNASALADANWEAIRQVLHAKDTPANVPETLGESDRNSLLFGQRNKLKNLRSNLGKLAYTHPGAPPRAHVMLDKPRAAEPFIFVRGSRANRGAKVPRQFLEHLAPNRKPFGKGSGRLELARAIVDPKNPLTARVMVNRVWAHHFGRGLVVTPSDFGLRAQPPSHPMLLDWLAARFVADGWSIKKLHRHIMLSATYQQESSDRAGYSRNDPANTLLWKMNRQRLSFEALRDAILQASGQLDLAVGGRPVNIAKHPSTPRRTLYGFIDRQNLPALFRTFDFANPDAHCPERFENTVPQQALFLMNSPFLIAQSDKLQEIAAKQAPLGQARVKVLYQKIFQRNPTDAEIIEALKFLEAAGGKEQNQGFNQLAQVLLLSNEFGFVD
jgi:hypothetical protein